MSYPVGYKRPPAHTRFRPGQSGNPKGRPKLVQDMLWVTANRFDIDRLARTKKGRRRLARLYRAAGRPSRNATKNMFFARLLSISTSMETSLRLAMEEWFMDSFRF